MTQKKPEQAVILCGGLGTRLLPYTKDCPKPMVLCNGKPFLWHLMQQLSQKGVKRFLLLTGYLTQLIEDYFGNGLEFGWDISYSQGPVEWDTGTRLCHAQSMIEDEFLLMYSDNFASFPYDEMWELHKKNNLPITLMVSPKRPGNIKLGKNNIVEKYDNDRGNDELKYVEIGYMLVSKKSTFEAFENRDCSFSAILRKLVSAHNVCAYIQAAGYHSISDPQRWKITEKYLTPKKILLLDRDGVINTKAAQGEYISRWENFEIIQDSWLALKQLSNYGFSFVIITNQAGVARGMVDQSHLDIIHSNLMKHALESGINILSIQVCPHHWEDDCECRKPKPGMFYSAAKEFYIRLDKSIYVGDDIRDCEAAFNANCASLFIGDGVDLKRLPEEMQPKFAFSRLSDCVNEIIGFYS